jgi:2-dehydro-3-deoxyglucarate aldolase/4-hydroxy-2-oxoheptanedioate aldolase
MTRKFLAGPRNTSPLGTLLSLPSPEIAEIALEAGFDWLFLDMEHGLLDPAAVQRMIQAAAGRVPCIVRVPTHDAIAIGKALDTGADGLIFPHVNSAAEARECVRAAQYPPDGSRSVGIARAQAYGARLAEAVAGENKRLTLIAQIEHIRAVRNIEEILETAGLDAVFIGPYDLSASLGIPGQVQDPAVAEPIEIVRTAARKFGIPAGIFAGGIEAARAALDKGFDFVCVVTDTLLIADAARRTLDALRKAIS